MVFCLPYVSVLSTTFEYPAEAGTFLPRKKLKYPTRLKKPHHHTPGLATPKQGKE